MEVADQWRREWAGSAEYGKVTEGGVTRRVARAMEVLHASGPGARMRVMRAAYHSSAGPGVPESSYMLHSSRRVISSGFNFLEPPSLPSLPSKPMEISSTPLESSPDSNTETENYKVTEPDDLEISEPSKWRGSTGASSIRMPSEESSSTDNASIVDLDSRTTKNILTRKYSYDSECSDVQGSKRNSARASPLLDTPVTLNTLKYKSLLNGSNEWNNRRKSYSFEDTSPLNEILMHNNDTFAMESSTDSGICKSSEIMNDHIDDNSHSRYSERKERKSNTQDESFKEWLFKNRSNSFYKGTKFKNYREHDVVIEDPVENNITLQSTGKVAITLPITIEKGDGHQLKKSQVSDDSQRKVKKVEFCKTELHFAAESGKVNIIATDEKPPPSNDFRRRRSAFVPMHEITEKPITLFGEKGNDLTAPNRVGDIFNFSNSEFGESDENTAATKSILKNKIPKPKPYLLGENMAFGSPNGLSNKDQLIYDSPIITAVSLINKQLLSERRHSDDITSGLVRETGKIVSKIDAFRTIDDGPSKNNSLNTDQYVSAVKSPKSSRETVEVSHVNAARNKFHVLQMSPVQARPTPRKLRESDLTYFGIDNDLKNNRINKSIYVENRLSSDDSAAEDIFHSVRLIQKITNSVCNSEAESDDSPEYQNVPLNSIYAPVPTPRLRSKYDDKPNEIEEIQILKPIIEHEIDDTSDINKPTTRRSRHRRQEETTTPSNRSLSEPPKKYRDTIETSHRLHNQLRCTKYHAIEDNVNDKLNKSIATKGSINTHKKVLHDNIPLYVNLNNEDKTRYQNPQKKDLCPRRSLQQETQNKVDVKREDCKSLKTRHSKESIKTKQAQGYADNENLKRKPHSADKNNLLQNIDNVEINQRVRHHRKTPDVPYVTRATNKSKENQHTDEQNTSRMKSQYRSRSLQRPSTNIEAGETSTHGVNASYRKISTEKQPTTLIEKNNTSRDRLSSNEKSSPKKEFSKTLQKRDPNTTEYSVHTMQIKSNERITSNKHSNGKLISNRTHRKSEYVINYDDKNGTVSSVRKIKSFPGEMSRKEKVPKERIKESPNENVVVRKKTLNKIALRK